MHVRQGLNGQPQKQQVALDQSFFFIFLVALRHVLATIQSVANNFER